MTPTSKAVALFLVVASGAVVADEAQKPMTAQQAMAYAKQMDAKERASMMDQTRELEQSITQLQGQVRALQARIAESPKYFDRPLANPLRP